MPFLTSRSSTSYSAPAPGWLGWSLAAASFAFLGLFLALPLALIATEALAKGGRAYLAAISSPDSVAALRLTLISAGIAVPLNTSFGVAAAWLVTKFEFRGRGLLLSLIDLPFSVSPVISGLIFVLLFGLQGLLGPWMLAHGLRIIYAPAGIILATLFVTFPFVARELIPVMESLGSEEEEAARVLGASGWQVFWGLFYGIILCNARAMGEFGAVSVVSGHIRGQTNTLPLHVEILYNDYSFGAAFACASLLALLALVTLGLKSFIEWRGRGASLEGRP